MPPQGGALPGDSGTAGPATGATGAQGRTGAAGTAGTSGAPGAAATGPEPPDRAARRPGPVGHPVAVPAPAALAASWPGGDPDHGHEPAPGAAGRPTGTGYAAPSGAAFGVEQPDRSPWTPVPAAAGPGHDASSAGWDAAQADEGVAPGPRAARATVPASGPATESFRLAPPEAAGSAPASAAGAPAPASASASASASAGWLGPASGPDEPDGPDGPGHAPGSGQGAPAGGPGHDTGGRTPDVEPWAPSPGGGTPPPGPPVPGAADPREVPPASAATAGPVCVACGLGGVDPDGYCEHCGHAQPRLRDHQERELEGVAAVSDRGLRHHRNEDAFAVAQTSLPDGTPAVVAVVCDGVSSAYRPDDASAAAAEVGSAWLLAALERGSAPEAAMHDALLKAADAVAALAEEDDREPHHNAPACTCVSAVAAGPVFTVGWIGDSRAYWVPDDRTTAPARLTEDDSWAARMVSAGLMSETEAYADERAHAITGWLGADAVEILPHTASFQPEAPGVVVVCTDGLWNYAESAAELAAAMPPDARHRPLHCAQTLVGVALDGGGHDNVTVAILPFPAAAGRPGPPSSPKD